MVNLLCLCRVGGGVVVLAAALGWPRRLGHEAAELGELGRAGVGVFPGDVPDAHERAAADAGNEIANQDQATAGGARAAAPGFADTDGLACAHRAADHG